MNAELLARELLDDCGVMSAMTATSGGKHRFDSLAETCFFQARTSTSNHHRLSPYHLNRKERPSFKHGDRVITG